MNDEFEKNAAAEEACEQPQEEARAVSLEGQEEDIELFCVLCEKLEDVIPQEIFKAVTSVRPFKFANKVLLDLGGRIRINNPEIDLTGNYDLPEEVKELFDTVDDFSFEIALSPFMALAQAFRIQENIDEEVIQSRDLEGFVPMTILKEDEPVRFGLVDYNEHQLALSMDSPFQVRIDISEDQTDPEAVAKLVADTIGSHCIETMKQMESNPPKLFGSEEEEAAVKTWCEKHGYSVFGAFRTGIDLYH